MLAGVFDARSSVVAVGSRDAASTDSVPCFGYSLDGERKARDVRSLRLGLLLDEQVRERGEEGRDLVLGVVDNVGRLGLDRHVCPHSDLATQP